MKFLVSSFWGFMVIALREDASFLYTTIEPFVIQLQEYVKMTTNDIFLEYSKNILGTESLPIEY